MTPDARAPVTVITGFLGSGKTTLVNRILHEQHGRRIAVIENELGEAGIDGEILLQDGAEIVEMNNGCICCTVRGDLVRILATLAERRAAGDLVFEQVVIETTGLADPAPVTQTFFAEPDVLREYRLDGVVTLVDAKHGERTLSEHREAQAQVGYADRIVLTKADLVSENERAALIARLRRMNVRAPVHIATHGRADVDDLLEIGGFDLDGAGDIEDLHGHAHARHSDEVASFVCRETRAYELEKLESFLGLLVDRHGADMLRYKGMLYVAGREERIVFQGVQTLLGAEPGKPWAAGELRRSTLVFIGRKLPRALIEQGLALCVEGSDADPATVLRQAA